MAHYTTEVRSICEHYAGLQESVGYSSVSDVLDKSVDKVFDFDFPIFDESYRKTLEKKILKHYYTREIGDETVGLWKLRLDTKMNEIMPYYNQLYKSTVYDINPFYDVDLSRSHQLKSEGDSNTNSSEDYSGNSKLHRSDTGSSAVDSNNTINMNSSSAFDNESIRNEDRSSKSNSSNTSDGEVKDTGNDTSVTTTTGTSTGKNRYSDTPQGSLQNIENNTYLTNATITDGTTSGNETRTDNTNDTSTSHTTASGENETSGTVKNSDNNKGESNSASTSSNVGNSVSTNNNDSDTEQNSQNTSEKSSSTAVNNVEEYIEHVVGKQGTESYASLLLKFRKTFLNIDMMIIEELQPLFFELW